MGHTLRELKLGYALLAENVAYSTFVNGCGVIPDPLPSYTEVFSGGCVEGYVGWEIKSSDVKSLVMFDNPLSYRRSTERMYFSLVP